MDEAILRVLPEGAQFLSSDAAATSNWTKTSCVSVSLPDRSIKKFFLKVGEGETSKTMLRGEFTAASEIYNIMPNFIPKPYGWGKMQSTTEDSYFYISAYRQIAAEEKPNETDFLKRLIELHRESTPPDGRYGFYVNTCDGAVARDLTWRSTWPDLFAQLLRHIVSLDAGINGNWEPFNSILAITYSRVIPRLLGALSLEGRTLKPSLIHGDMFHGNYGLDADHKEVIIWDASSYYAHSEMEMGVWRWDESMTPLIQTYLDLCGGPSEPAEEFDDRNRLYSVLSKLNFSTDGGEEGKKMRIV